jgi:Asp-tRNA(Asn)/Glu-tRNA(Gln) amidotransferase A subunit family amidase
MMNGIQPIASGNDSQFCHSHALQETQFMMNRRTALAVLGSAGIGTAAFQRALAAQVDDGPVTLEMIADAEWVAGIKLTDAQRQTAVNALKWAREETKRVRAIEIDNSLLPGLNFTPFASPPAHPDPRGYEVVKSPSLAAAPVSRPASDEDVAFSSIKQLGALLRARKISSVELTKLYLDRLRRYDPLLKCVVTFMDELALAAAKRADQELQAKHDRGPLHGIPWGLKDIFAYPGYPTTWGLAQYRDRVIDVKPAVAERLEHAGAVLIAKLATNTLAGGSLVWYRGVTRNPWNPRLDAAGSSSGSAAATAAGLVGFSIGTETSASLIGPASKCGAVGLRATYGRVSRYGCMQLCWSLDKIGPICRNADDCGLVLSAIHGADPRDAASCDRPFTWPSSRKLSTIRVGYIKQGDHDADRDDLRVLRDLGVELVPVDGPNFKKDFGLTTQLQVGIVASESAASFEDLTRRGEPKGVKGWPQYFMLGHFLTAGDYLKLNRLRSIIMQRFDKMMQGVDAFLCHSWKSPSEPVDDWYLYGNLTGHPMITLPKELKWKDGYRLPKPQMMIGRLYDESTLLALAHACQQAAGLKRRPPLDQFLAQKDEILAGEEFPDENKYYTD